MRLLSLIVAALWASAATAATVRVVPFRTANVTEAQVAVVARAAEESLRELSTLVLQPSLPVALTVGGQCGATAQSCWAALAGKASADYAVVVVGEPAGGGLAVDVVMVDFKARRVTQRRFNAPGPDAAGRSAREAVEALVPALLRRGYGGLVVDLPRGARLKVDGRVVLTEPPRAPLPVPSGRHEIDLLLPDGTAVLRRTEVAEGKTAALELSLRQASSETPRSNDALLVTSAALWGAGAVAMATSFALASAGNVRAQQLAPCVVGHPCLTLEDARKEHEIVTQYMGAANVLMWGGGALAVGGAGVFTFDLIQGGGR